MHQNYIKNSEAWEGRSNFSNWKFFLLAILGGFFIGLGYFVYHIVIANPDMYGQARYFIAAALFPVGIIFCVFFGGTLFTLDTGISLKLFEKKIKVKKVFSVWGVVLLGNFIGAFIVAILASLTQAYETSEMQQVLTDNLQNKANMSWYVSLVSGIICGIIVGLTVWIVHTLKSATTRFLILWIIITFFVVTGTQHVVANMYVFALGWIQRSDFSSIGAIFESLIPTMVGNWIAGSILVPGAGFLLNKLSLKEN